MHVFASSLSTMRVPAVSVLLLAGLSYITAIAAIAPERRRELRKDTKEVCYDARMSMPDHLVALGARVQQLH